MLCDKLCLTLAWLVAAVSLVPRAHAVPSELLSALADTSICKAEVTYTVNKDRVPSIIKQVKCAQSPDMMCPALDGADGEASCCQQNSHLSTTFSCRDVIDTVQVMLGGLMTPQKVYVGCACVMQRSTGAADT